MSGPRIVVAGAGAVGCFVGGLLAAAGRDIVLLGRARMRDDLARHGLHLSDVNGGRWRARVPFETEPAALRSADIVLVCVKSGATATIGRSIAEHAPARAVVVSLQNGLAAASCLRDQLPGRDLRAAVVGFNVVAQGQGRFHRATSGEIVIERGPAPLAALRGVPGLDVEEAARIAQVQWGKLLLNLTNAVNALSGLGLRDMLLEREWRRVMAAQLDEARAVLRAAGIAARVPAAAPGWAIPHILRLPSWAFRRVAAPMLAVDAAARTSMVADLEAGRPTEIDAFQGEIVRLGRAHGVDAPVNARVLDAVRSAAGGATPRPRPRDLLGR